jgi:hypothetical protein
MHQYTCKKCCTSFQSSKKGKQYCSHACYAKRFDPVTKRCETCGCDFTVAYRFRGQKTCGMECAKTAISKTLTTRETKQCLACGNGYEVTQSYKDDAKYCSYECFLSTRKTRQPDVVKTCEGCKQEFSVPFPRSEQRFCGYSCANSGENNAQFGLGKLQGWNTVSRWHAGKTKETDHRLRAMGEKISIIISDKIVNGNWKHIGFKGEHYTGVKNGGKVAYLRSSYELVYAKILDADTDVVSWEHEPFRIPYVYEGSVHNYVPDFLVAYTHGTFLVEVKPDCLTETVQNAAKRRAAESWCEANGIGYLSITEQHLSV